MNKHNKISSIKEIINNIVKTKLTGIKKQNWNIVVTVLINVLNNLILKKIKHPKMFKYSLRNSDIILCRCCNKYCNKYCIDTWLGLSRNQYQIIFSKLFSNI